MNRRPTPPARRLLILLALATAFLVSSATAQVDDRARALLEGLRPTEVEAIETLDQTTVMIVEAQGGTEVRSRTVLDYVGQRARIDTEVAPGMTATVLIVDGTLSMVVGGMRLPLPPELGEEFGDIFETDPNDPLAGIDSATFDGRVTYADLVAGDQVTVTGAAEVAGLDGSGDTRYVFADDGGLLAVATEGDAGATILMVFDQPLRGSPVVGRSATMYELRGDQAQRMATIRYEDVRINEPIPDDTF
jgi:outer membrane lipoprotein-sorting protein